MFGKTRNHEKKIRKILKIEICIHIQNNIKYKLAKKKTETDQSSGFHRQYTKTPSRFLRCLTGKSEDPIIL